MSDQKKSKTPSEIEGKEDKKEEKDYKAQAQENLAGWQKALADYQNLQKEMDKRISEMNQFVSAAMIFELLPIFDNYKTAIDHIPENQKKEQWAIGLEHILKMWDEFLKNHDVEKIKTVGEKFDPHLHESVGEVNDDKSKDQIITEEKQTGYKINGSVIRPAKVIINNK